MTNAERHMFCEADVLADARRLLAGAVTAEYAGAVLDKISADFFEDVASNSEYPFWYSDSDVKTAIGRALLRALGGKP